MDKGAYILVRHIFSEQHLFGVHQLTPADHVRDPGLAPGRVATVLGVDRLRVVLGSSSVVAAGFGWKTLSEFNFTG